MKTKREFKCLTFIIDEAAGTILPEHQVPIADSTGDNQADWDKMCSSLPPMEGRYVVFDFKFKSTDGRDQDKLVFVAWYVRPSVRARARKRAKTRAVHMLLRVVSTFWFWFAGEE